MDLLSGARRYLTNLWQISILLREPDATASLQSWHSFNRGEQRWTALPSDDSSGTRTSANASGPGSGSNKEATPLSLWTWNVDAFGERPEARMDGIIAAIQNHAAWPADVLFFQEVSHAALAFLLAHPWIRENWYASDVDAANWAKQKFGTVTLLFRRSFDHESAHGTKSRIGLLWRVRYPSRFGRDALCCEVFLPPGDVPVRLVNVHLDSLPIQPSRRPRQLAIVARMLHSAGRGVVAGDFNPVLPGDNALVAENKLVDAWVELHPGEDGYTWGIDGQQLFPPSRMDKVAMVGLRAQQIDVVHPGVLPKRESSEVGGEGQPGGSREGEINGGEASEQIPWSDHSGLRCIFGLVDVAPS